VIVDQLRDISTARRRPRYRTWVIVGGLATTAAFTIALTLCNHAIEEHRPSVAAVESRDNLAHMSVSKDPTGTAEIRRGNKPHRSGSDSVSIGDTLVLHVKAAPPFELRVYGDTGEPLARCSETQGCSLENDGNVRQFRLELELRASGDVRAVLFTGASIPDAFQDLNTDVETAQRAKVDAHQIAVVHVQ
jgi:4-amino-4-deoxy-L-arabinose transferase-like glycosyltransferase